MAPWWIRTRHHIGWVAALFGLILALAAPSAGADREGDPLAVPLMADQRPGLTQTMYAERRSVAFVVLDCAPGQPLWTEASNAASTWNIDAPVELRVHRASSGCEGSPTNLANEIYFAPVDTPAPEVGDYHYATANGRIQAEDLRVSMREVVERARELDTSTRIVIFNQLMNAFGHVLGLGDAHRLHPDDCHWSVMLGNCRFQRAMPTEADRDALAHLYDTATDRRADLRRFDANDNGRIDDPEFRDALRLWIRGRVTDDMFLDLLQAWNRGERIGGASTQIQAEPNGPSAIRIFDLNGRLVAERGCFQGRRGRGRQTAWRAQRMLNAQADLPAGSYIARIRGCDTGHVAHRFLVKTP
ncbi:MAG: hypothetical protein ABEL51_15885 [Salinibacter sp.]